MALLYYSFAGNFVPQSGTFGATLVEDNMGNIFLVVDKKLGRILHLKIFLF